MAPQPDAPDPAGYAAQVGVALHRTDFDLLERIGSLILDTKATDATIFTAGNGGSGSTASHMVNDLVKGCRVDEQPGFKAWCLNDSNALLTCLANDYSYDQVFALQLDTLARPGDVLVVFSGSGESPNIVDACATARRLGLTVIGFGGRDGGRMKELCDLCLVAPTHSMEQIEDLHLAYTHALVHYLRARLSARYSRAVLQGGS